MKAPQAAVTASQVKALKADLIAQLTQILPKLVNEAVKGAPHAQEGPRKTQHGVREPREGGKCYTVWDELDKLAMATGTVPALHDITELAVKRGLNQNNARIEFYSWKRFHGYKTGATVQVARAAARAAAVTKERSVAARRGRQLGAKMSAAH